MKPQRSTHRPDAGITLLEVMILMAILAVIAAAVLFPSMARSNAKASRVSCVNNLKQVGLSVRAWAMDHGGRYPARTPMAQGGTLDHPLGFRAWVHWQVLSNELSTPKVLICPQETQRVAAEDFESNLRNDQVSYFIGLDAGETVPQMILSGDRDLTTNGVRLGPGLYSLKPSDVVGWAGVLHKQAGNTGLADGSVQQFSAAGLQQYLAKNPQTNRLAIP
jgi:type II secretory pathway pseudopilin PulG